MPTTKTGPGGDERCLGGREVWCVTELRSCGGSFPLDVHRYDNLWCDGTRVPFARQTGRENIPRAEAYDVDSANLQLRKRKRDIFGGLVFHT